MSETSNTCYVCGHPITYEEKRTAFVDSHSTEACIPYLMADKDEAEARAAALQAELDSVDWILSGRPALAEKGTRREKIEYALHTAGKADAALARAAAAEERERATLADRDRIRAEAVGALTAVGIYMLVDADPTGPGEVRSAIKRLAAERDARRSEAACFRAVIEQHAAARLVAEERLRTLEAECIRLEDKLARGSWDVLVMLNPDGTCKVCGPDCKVTR